MRRIISLVVLLFCAVPIGISVAGCSKKTAVVYCDGNESGPVVGQITTITLNPRLSGISLNEGEIGNVNAPQATDCKSTNVTATFTYGISNLALVDIQATTGRLCAGVWNRNSGGGVADYTTCTPNNGQGVAFVTASAGGAVSNPVPVFVHPVVTSIVLGPASINCTTDPASNCIDLTQPSACDVGPIAVPAQPVYTGTCLSQGSAAQLAARVYAGGGTTQNISCLAGPLTFSAQSPAVAGIDENGVATAAQPGSTIINAATTQTSSSAGFFSTCPPASIQITTSGSATVPTAPVTVSQNITQDLVATVFDNNIGAGFPNGHPITNITLTYESTVPQTVPAGSATVTPAFPGAAAITAICQPPTCNSSPFNQIGLFGNGLTVTSNPLQINATGTGNSTVLYVGSTGSQYIQPFDFTLTTQPSSVRLPYAPNSMILSEDLTTIYMGAGNELMIFATGSNQLTREDASISGVALAVSPDNSTLVFTDPVRQLVYLYSTASAAGGVTTEYGGTGTRAEFSPDSQTVYITTSDGRLLVHSTFTGWTSVALPSVASDVAVTVPNAGAYLATQPTVTARTNCPITSVSGSYPNTQTSNVFYPQADVTTATADRLAATNDGIHMLGASVATGLSDISLSAKTGACPIPFSSTTPPPQAFTTAIPSVITGVLPTTDSAFAFVTYTGTGGVLPQYVPATRVLSYVPLQRTAAGTPTAPVAGVISSDNQTFYVGTSGDNLVHQLTRSTTGFSDTVAPLKPTLPGINGGSATPNLLVQRPRKATG